MILNSNINFRNPTGSKSGKIVLNSPIVNRVVQIESLSTTQKAKAEKTEEAAKDDKKDKKKEKKVEEVKKEGKVEEREIYFIGIIDMLTVYDFEKKVAHTAKTISYKSVRIL